MRSCRWLRTRLRQQLQWVRISLSQFSQKSTSFCSHSSSSSSHRLQTRRSTPSEKKSLQIRQFISVLTVTSLRRRAATAECSKLITRSSQALTSSRSSLWTSPALRLPRFRSFTTRTLRLRRLWTSSLSLSTGHVQRAQTSSSSLTEGSMRTTSRSLRSSLFPQ